MTDSGASAFRRTVDSLLLFHLPDRRLDLAATVTAALLLVVSRFAYIANGPWEWDETLFARGILHFELAARGPLVEKTAVKVSDASSASRMAIIPPSPCPAAYTRLRSTG